MSLFLGFEYQIPLEKSELSIAYLPDLYFSHLVYKFMLNKCGKFFNHLPIMTRLVDHIQQIVAIFHLPTSSRSYFTESEFYFDFSGHYTLAPRYNQTGVLLHVLSEEICPEIRINMKLDWYGSLGKVSRKYITCFLVYPTALLYIILYQLTFYSGKECKCCKLE